MYVCVCVCVCVRRVEDERESQCARRAAEGALLLLRTTRIGIREGGEKGRWTGWNEKPGTETFRRRRRRGCRRRETPLRGRTWY